MIDASRKRMEIVARQISITLGSGVSYNTNCSSVRGAEEPIKIAGPEAIRKYGAIDWESQEFLDWLTQENEVQSGREIGRAELKEVIPVDDGDYGEFILCFRRWIHPTEAEYAEYYAEYGMDSVDAIGEVYGAWLSAHPIDFAVVAEGNQIDRLLRLVVPFCWGQPKVPASKAGTVFYVVGRLDDVVFNDYWPVRRSNVELITTSLEDAEEAFSKLTTGEGVVDQYNFLGKLSTDGTVETIKGPQFI